MPSLADVQAGFRDALVTGTFADIAPLLVGGEDPAARLEVHRRHYETSLVGAILRRFPGTVWLTGEPFLRAAARDFVRRHPPTAPCIAEYAEDFPDSLAHRPGADDVPYLASFARLEWHLGQVASAVEHAPLALEALSRWEAHHLPDLRLCLQSGLRYLAADWPVDRLIQFYLTDAAPASYRLEPASVRLQFRGARGGFRIDRLDPGSFAFRSTLAAGLTLGQAAERALEADPAFDPGRGLAELFAEGLATHADLETEGMQP